MKRGRGGDFCQVKTFDVISCCLAIAREDGGRGSTDKESSVARSSESKLFRLFVRGEDDK